MNFLALAFSILYFRSRDSHNFLVFLFVLYTIYSESTSLRADNWGCSSGIGTLNSFTLPLQWWLGPHLYPQLAWEVPSSRTGLSLACLSRRKSFAIIAWSLTPMNPDFIMWLIGIFLIIWLTLSSAITCWASYFSTPYVVISTESNFVLRLLNNFALKIIIKVTKE